MKNNKGFAITTLVYGLSIMAILIIAILMGTMSTTRANNRALARAIEKELNVNSSTNKIIDGAMITTGDYLEEVFIVPAGETGWYRIELWGSNGTGGYGAYTSGIIKLNEYDTLHFYVGKASSGKETDVRLVGGPYDDRTSYDSRIMVAAGGGYNSGADGGTHDGYKNMAPANIPKTLRGIRGNNGGDGYFPTDRNDAGGVSYISGFGGGASIIKGTVEMDNPTYQYAKTIYNEEEDTYSYEAFGSKFIFYNGIMMPGVSKTAGKASIEKLSEQESLPIRNTKLNDVKEIIDCMAGTNSVSKISAVVTGINSGRNITPTAVADPESLGGTCKKISFSATRLDEISTFHTSGENPSKHRIIIIKNNGSMEVLKAYTSETSDKSETAKVSGYRISAYEFDSTNKLPDIGLYYIIPAQVENKVITAIDNSQLSEDYLKGSLYQKFQIESTNDGKYTIIETTKNKAIESVSDVPKTINASRNTQTEQKWDIIPLKNGYYRIKNVYSNKYLQYSTSSITLSTSTDDSSRFKFYKIDLS